jgi:hypothetical protein|tara:strand:+ start:2314 stop:3798 length:1485 start_codon:yes stop_codon:yes gene_type:complete
MGQPVPVSLGDGYYVSDSLPLSNQRCLNVYVDIPQTATLSEAVLKGTAGLTQIATSGAVNQINRGSHVKDGKPYFLNGETLYRLDRDIASDGTETFTMGALGTIPGTTRCSFSDNGTQLIILTTTGAGYIVNEAAGTVFQQITDVDFTTTNGSPQYVVYVDSFFVVTTDTKRVIKSSANDGLAWSALDFTTAAADPDAIVAPIVVKNKLTITGKETIEGFDNLGLSGFPFQRNGLFVQKGCFAPHSLINVNDGFMFIGGAVDESPAVWTLNGATPQKISTTAIDAKLQTFTQDEILASFAISYAQAGGYFVEFSLPLITLVYDMITQVWHEKESQIIDSKGLTKNLRHRVNSLVTAYGRVLCGDSQDGRIGELSTSVYNEYGNPILRAFSLQPFADMGTAISLNNVELTMESGVGNDVQPNPEIRLSASSDGKNFNDPIPAPLGKIGEYDVRQNWRRLGRFSRFGILLFEFSDPNKFRALKLRMNIKQGSQRGR